MNKNYLQSFFNTFILSLICFIAFLLLIILSLIFPNLPTVNISNLRHVSILTIISYIFVFLSLVFFLVGGSDLTNYYIDKKNIRNIFLKKLIYLFIFFTLPFYIYFNWFYKLITSIILKRFNLNFSKNIIFKRVLFVLFVIFILTPIWIIGYFTIGLITTRFIEKQLGYAPITEYVSGTGSMYPTFPKGEKATPIDQFNETVAKPFFISYPSGIVILEKRYFGRNLKRGDIITFTNQKTMDTTKKQYGIATGFMKRLIALPGDVLEIKGGIVYLNGAPLKEPYTAKPRSTFGEEFLKECKSIRVPKNQIFAMGDNRKGSGDSREIGFINLKDIDHVLPIENQKGVWDKNYRDTTNDFSENSKIKLDKNEYLRLLNEKRSEYKAKSLQYEPKLEISAKIRGETIIKFDDFSFNATKSGITMRQAMTQADYSNITYGEAPTQGYFEASELIENQFQFPKTKDFLLNNKYQDFGVSEVEGEINNCPTQVIIQHFAGYVPPDYPQDLIKSWENALNSLNNVSKGWKDLKEIPNAYQKAKSDIDRIVDIINQRQTSIQGILDKMNANLWLTDAQNEYTKTIDKALGEEEIALAKKINNLLK